MSRRLPGAFVAALVISLALAPLLVAKPPDLPHNPIIIVQSEPKPDEHQPPATNLRDLLNSSLFLGVDPLLGLWTDECSAVDEPSSAVEPMQKEPEDHPCCRCCAVLHQVGMCWWSQFCEWCKKQNTSTSSCGKVERLLQKPITAYFEEEQLSQALDILRRVSGLPIVLDQEALTAAGIDSLDWFPVTFHVQSVPLHAILDLMLRPHHLKAVVKGGIVSIEPDLPSAGKTGEKVSAEAPQAKACESVCPKCEALHAQHCAARLMKACYQAVAEGQFEKAANLARQAHAIDPATVEGDPLIYKLHLNIYPLMTEEEGFGSPTNLIEYEYERIRFTDPPSHLMPERTSDQPPQP
jgi:hypothetical protein